MSRLASMPQIEIKPGELLPFGKEWNENNRRLSRTPPYSSMELGTFFDNKVGQALADMLGSISVVSPSSTSLVPKETNCVEVGACRIIGGLRPQNFDVGYRHDGVKFAFDSKTLNDSDSVRKNYQNMINDLGTEATTVHTRFPYAIVAFLVAVPTPCLNTPQKEALTETLERLTLRSDPLNSNHKAEAITLVLWDPDIGEINHDWPPSDSPLRIEKFSEQIEKSYKERYKGLPPHNE
jgi:hypothetical protein